MHARSWRFSIAGIVSSLPHKEKNYERGKAMEAGIMAVLANGEERMMT
jgi:hypothetical protein